MFRFNIISYKTSFDRLVKNILSLHAAPLKLADEDLNKTLPDRLQMNMQN